VAPNGNARKFLGAGKAAVTTKAVATSLADIARASDISKAGLLHHYSSKDQAFLSSEPALGRPGRRVVITCASLLMQAAPLSL